MSAMVTWIIERDPESGGYVASVAELPGCYTQARNMADLRETVAEALGVHPETRS